MPGYIPPTDAENKLYAAVMRAAAYEFEAEQIDPDRRRKLDETVANYARVLVFEINQRSSDLQPAGWTLNICDDPYTEIAGWKAKTDRVGEKVQFLAGFNRELTDEIEQLRKDAKATARRLEFYAELESRYNILLRAIRDVQGLGNLTEEARKLVMVVLT